jgi:hypothetical protein
MQPGDILVYFGSTGCSSEATRRGRHRTGGAPVGRTIILSRSPLSRRKRRNATVSVHSGDIHDVRSKQAIVRDSEFVCDNRDKASLFRECIVRVAVLQGSSCEEADRVISSTGTTPLSR